MSLSTAFANAHRLVKMANDGIIAVNIALPLLRDFFDNGRDVTMDDVEVAAQLAGENLAALRLAIEQYERNGGT